jgi:hypothetical protein
VSDFGISDGCAMTPVPTSSQFYAFQTLADLREVAGRAASETLAQIMGAIPVRATAADLAALIAGGCRLTEAMVREVHPPLLLAATLPSEGDASFAAATAVLLADRLQDGAGPDDLFHHWDALAGDYRGLAPPERAALLRGFALGHARGQVALDAPPAGEELLTRSRPQALAALRAAARRLGGADIDAAMGEGIEGARLRAALRFALDSGLARLPDEPEVTGAVMRAADDPAHPGFAPATALLLAGAILRGDAERRLARRWAGFGAVLLDLPPAERDPVVEGFRHLAESSPEWDPFAGWSAARLAAEGVAIPLPLV